MSNVVNIAKSYEGKVKYVFGAQDPDGGKSDCSGFTMVVFQKAGYSIPRTTGGVWTDSKLKKVEKTDLKAGDLILFKNTYNSGSRPPDQQYYYCHKWCVSHFPLRAGRARFPVGAQSTSMRCARPPCCACCRA